MKTALPFAGVVLCLLACPALAAPASPPETMLATVRGFLGDPAVPPLVLPEGARLSSPPREWAPRVKEVLCLPLSSGDLPRAGYVVTNATGEQLLDFMAPWPIPPVPMQELTAAEAQAVAEDFARRRLPELYAAGGEVKASLEEEITPYGAWLVSLQRVQEGVQVLTRALVGVRVYDGKIVRWRPEHTPLAMDLTLKLSAEDAKAIAAANMHAETWEPVLWLEATPEVIGTEPGQRVVWTVWAEIKTKNTRNVRSLEKFCRWRVDAATGEMVERQTMEPTRELYWWYVKCGGTRFPENLDVRRANLHTDRRPAVSPDGRRILFFSDRPRPGYPLWLERPEGLFVSNLDGSGLACLCPGGIRLAAWIGEGKQIALVRGDSLVLLDLETGAETPLTVDKPWVCSGLAALPEGRLAAILTRGATESQLVVLDPAKPADKPVALVSGVGTAEMVSALVTDRQGRVLFTVWTNCRMIPPSDPRRPQEPYRLCVLETATAEAQPKVLVPYLKIGSAICCAPGGKLLVSDLRSPERLLVDLESGTAAPWTPPRIEQPGRRGEGTVYNPQDIAFLPDGSRMLFVADYWSGKPEDRVAQVVYACNPDSTGPTLVTTPERSPAAAYVFPGTNRPAFGATPTNGS